jgi:hypothetical protein
MRAVEQGEYCQAIGARLNEVDHELAMMKAGRQKATPEPVELPDILPEISTEFVDTWPHRSHIKSLWTAPTSSYAR